MDELTPDITTFLSQNTEEDKTIISSTKDVFRYTNATEQL